MAKTGSGDTKARKTEARFQGKVFESMHAFRLTDRQPSGQTKPGTESGRRHLSASMTEVLGREASRALVTPGPEGREAVRRAVEEGLPVEAVKRLQEELGRFGVPRPSHYVESIASRASRSRRNTLTREEGEKLIRVAAVLARALDVWEDEGAASDFLTLPHPELGNETPIDRAKSEIGARQVEDLLLRLDLGMPV